MILSLNQRMSVTVSLPGGSALDKFTLFDMNLVSPDWFPAVADRHLLILQDGLSNYSMNA